VVQSVVAPASQLPMVGASGAIAGVLGAYIVLYPSSRVTTLIPIFFIPWFIDIPAILYLGFWFALQFLSGVLALDAGALGGVAYWAHIGGFIAGLVLLPFFARRSRVAYQTSPHGYIR
jgi:membrane associated rhomboid family serine protease